MSITLKNVSYTYAPNTVFESPALQNVSLHIEQGEFVGLMGKTGCGKSTLIQLMDGLLPPTEGNVLLDGEDIFAKGYDRSKLRRKVGVVFQYPEYQLFESTVEKDVAFGLKHLSLTAEEKHRQVRWALETVGFDFDQVRELSPLEFSGGEKRRIAIAGVLAAKPEILILDEPIAGLDPLGREAFLRLTDTLNAQGVTILMISHNADALAEHARRILVLENGVLLRDEPSKTLFADTDFLLQHGLGIGQCRRIARLLQEKGHSIPDDVLRYEELLPHLLRIGKGAAK